MVVLGTYNMSWACDAFKNMSNKDLNDKITNGFRGISEQAFMNRDSAADGEGEVVRTFWTNSLTHLKQFIIEHRPLAVSLQEMNLTQDAKNGGTKAVEEMLNDLGDGYSYKLYSKSKDTPFKTSPALCFIVNTEEAGEIDLGNEYEEKIAKDEEDGHLNIRILENGTQQGRPMLIALTEKNILLVNMHGAQDPSLKLQGESFNNYMIKNKGLRVW